MKAAIQRHLAMLCQNQTSGCLPCQSRTTKNWETHWRRKVTGAPPPTGRTVRTPEPTPTLPGGPFAPPAKTGNTFGGQCSEMVDLPARYTYSHTAVPCAEPFDDDDDTQHYTDSDADMLTDQGWYNICCVVMRLISILKTQAAD